LSDFSLLQARRDAHAEETTRTRPRVIHEEPAHFHLSSSPKSRPPRSSRLLGVLDTTEPLSMRAEIRRMLAIPDFAGLQDVSTTPRSLKRFTTPRAKDRPGDRISGSTSSLFEPNPLTLPYSPNIAPGTGTPSPSNRDFKAQNTSLLDHEACQLSGVLGQSSESCFPSFEHHLLSSPVSLLNLDTSPAKLTFDWPTQILPDQSCTLAMDLPTTRI